LHLKEDEKNCPDITLTGENFLSLFRQSAYKYHPVVSEVASTFV